MTWKEPCRICGHVFADRSEKRYAPVKRTRCWLKVKEEHIDPVCERCHTDLLASGWTMDSIYAYELSIEDSTRAYVVVGVKRGTSALAWGLVMMSQRECFACR